MEYELLDSKTKLKKWLSVEKAKYKAHSFWPIGKRWFDQDRLYCFNWVLRHYEFYKNTNKKFRCLFFHLIHNKQEIQYRIYIGPNQCGEGLHIMHLGTILFNGGVRTGKNLSIHINTCLVAGGVASKAPQLGNNIVIGVNSVLSGSIEIADGVAVGANSFVNKSFTEPNITIAGSPAKKISEGGSAKWRKKVESVNGSKR